MALNTAAWPLEVATAPTPPSSAEIRSSKTAVVGFDISNKHGRLARC